MGHQEIAPIDWRLVTDLPVSCAEQAVEKLRWKIEVSHKILKLGSCAQEARLRTAERLVMLIAMFCALAWQAFRTTMLTRTAPGRDPRLAITKTGAAARGSFNEVFILQGWCATRNLTLHTW